MTNPPVSISPINTLEGGPTMYPTWGWNVCVCCVSVFFCVLVCVCVFFVMLDFCCCSAQEELASAESKRKQLEKKAHQQQEQLKKTEVGRITVNDRTTSLHRGRVFEVRFLHSRKRAAVPINTAALKPSVLSRESFPENVWFFHESCSSWRNGALKIGLGGVASCVMSATVRIIIVCMLCFLLLL